MTKRTSWMPAVLAALLWLCSGCASNGGDGRLPSRPASISHIVLISLNDLADADALLADCDARLTRIPSGVAYAAGKHVDTGRENVLADYDVGLYIGFDSLDGYAAYVEHPDHVGFVNDWRPRIRRLDIRDVLDDSP